MSTNTKETFYFKHDYVPTSDPKMKALLSQYKGIGYGMFWRIAEMLHTDSLHKLPHKQYIFIGLADEMGTDVEHVLKFVADCINVFELFESDGEYFWSNRVLRNLSDREEVKLLRSKAGKASAEAKRNRSQDEIPTNSSTNSPNNKQNSTHVEHMLHSVEQTPTNANKVNNNISFKKLEEKSISLGNGVFRGCRGENETEIDTTTGEITGNIPHNGNSSNDLLKSLRTRRMDAIEATHNRVPVAESTNGTISIAPT